MLLVLHRLQSPHMASHASESSLSLAERYERLKLIVDISKRLSSLVMRKEPSPERSTDASVGLSGLRAVRFSLTKLASCLPRLRMPYCECSRNGNLSESAAAIPFRPTSESLRLPTVT